MPRTCFVPGCKVKRSRKPGEKHVMLFSAPKDPVLRRQWYIASRRGDREMTERDEVCELHFTEDCIERHFTTVLWENETFTLERERPRLKKGSIPSIFSFSNSKSVSKRGRPKKQSTVQNKENGSRDFVLEKKSSPSKFSRQMIVLACSAYGCTNSSDKRIPGISFHRFPKNKTRRKAWISAIGKKNWQPSKDSVLCSAHFLPDEIECTRSIMRLKPGTVPTIFSLEDPQISRLPACLDIYGLSDSDRSECCTTETNYITDHGSDEDDRPTTEMEFSVQKENDEIPEEMSSPSRNMPSKYSISKNLIVEGHEEVFGKFIASELKTLLCDPPLYVRTKEKIWQVLEEASKFGIK